MGGDGERPSDRHRAGRRPRGRPIPLRRVLDSSPGLRSSSGLRHKPAVFLLHLDQPGDISSLDTIRAVTEVSPAISVMVVAARGDARFQRHAQLARATGCVLETTPDEQLVDAVRRTAKHMLAAMPPEPCEPPKPAASTRTDFRR